MHFGWVHLNTLETITFCHPLTIKIKKHVYLCLSNCSVHTWTSLIRSAVRAANEKMIEKILEMKVNEEIKFKVKKATNLFSRSLSVDTHIHIK